MDSLLDEQNKCKYFRVFVRSASDDDDGYSSPAMNNIFHAVNTFWLLILILLHLFTTLTPYDERPIERYIASHIKHKNIPVLPSSYVLFVH